MEADAGVFGDRLVRVLSRLAGKPGGRRALNEADKLRHNFDVSKHLNNRHARRGSAVARKMSLKAAAAKEATVAKRAAKKALKAAAIA